jgi:hypothetical protein
VRERDKRKEPLATGVDRKEEGKKPKKNVNGKKKEHKIENKKGKRIIFHKLCSQNYIDQIIIG